MKRSSMIVSVGGITIFLTVVLLAIITTSTANELKSCIYKFTSPAMPKGLSIEERCKISYQRTQDGVVCYQEVKTSTVIPYSYEITSLFLSKISSDYKGKDSFIELHNKYCGNYPNLYIE